MSVLEFLGDFLRWPASKRTEDVELCKSRLILQARALHVAIGIEPSERMLAYACDRGAAAWEHWLLTSERYPPSQWERTAHSGLTLAQRSGDWELVGNILETWKTIGEGHKRFYRDAVKAHEKHRPAFDRDLPELRRLASVLNELPDQGDDARKLLSLTESYAERGGPGLLLHARADAHKELSEQALSRRAELAACIANPHEWRLAWLWFARSAMAIEPQELSAKARERALGWYDQSVIVHAAALFLANTRQATEGPPSESLVESTLALPRSLESEAVLVFVFENTAWALALRGDLARADAILAEAIERAPTHRGLVDLRDATAHLMSESQSLVEINDEYAQQVKRDLPLSLAA